MNKCLSYVHNLNEMHFTFRIKLRMKKKEVFQG